MPGDAGTNDVAQPNHRWGDPDTRDAMMFVNASVPLDASQTRFLYAFGGFSHREANSAGFFRRALDARTWPQIYPNGFLPVIEPTVVDASAAVGVHGARGRWTYDVSGQYGRNSFAFTVGDSLNVSLGPSSTKSDVRRRNAVSSISWSPTPTSAARCRERIRRRPEPRLRG